MRYMALIIFYELFKGLLMVIIIFISDNVNNKSNRLLLTHFSPHLKNK